MKARGALCGALIPTFLCSIWATASAQSGTGGTIGDYFPLKSGNRWDFTQATSTIPDLESMRATKYDGVITLREIPGDFLLSQREARLRIQGDRLLMEIETGRSSRFVTVLDFGVPVGTSHTVDFVATDWDTMTKFRTSREITLKSKTTTMRVNGQRFTKVYHFRIRGGTAGGEVFDAYFARGLGLIRVDGGGSPGRSSGYVWVLQSARISGRGVTVGGIPNRDTASRTTRLGVQARETAVGGALFLPAYLLKEGIAGLETNDPGRLMAAAEAIPTTDFLRSYGAFVAGSAGTSAVLKASGASNRMAKSMPRAFRNLPMAAITLAAGIAAADAATGKADIEGVARSTASYLVGGAVTAPLYTLIRAAGPHGRFVGALAQFTHMTATLYVGDKLDQALAAGMDRLRSGRKDAGRTFSDRLSSSRASKRAPTRVRPLPPYDLTATVRSPRHVTVEWDGILDPHDRAASELAARGFDGPRKLGFSVRRTLLGPNWREEIAFVGPGDAMKFEDSSARPGETYGYQVFWANYGVTPDGVIGTLNYRTSNVAVVTMPLEPLQPSAPAPYAGPLAPGGRGRLSASVTGLREVRLDWNYNPRGMTPEMMRATFERSEDGIRWITVGRWDGRHWNRAADPTAQPGRTYSYRMIYPEWDFDGNTGWLTHVSAVATVTTPPE